MAKRVRRFSISRNKQYETHPVRWTRTIETQVSEISDTDWKKVKSETFEYLVASVAVLNQFAIFHDRDLTSDGEGKDCIVT